MKSWKIRKKWATDGAKWVGLCKTPTPYREMEMKVEKIGETILQGAC